MLYDSPLLLSGPLGNNTFSCEKRVGGLVVPACRAGGIHDVRMGTEVVFADVDERGRVVESAGLRSFIRTTWQTIPLVVVDNHNHVLPYWHEGIVSGILPRGCAVVHIDLHSDLAPNPHFPWELLSDDSRAVERYTHFRTRVGDYIMPAMVSGCVSRVVRIQGESDMDAYVPPDVPYIANIDLDFFAPEMDYIDRAKSLPFVRNIARSARLITVATSPVFVSQTRALEVFSEIFGDYLTDSAR